MKDKIIKDLFTYWENLRADRLAPARSEIDPRKIKGTLEHTFILETVSNGPPRFRLAGIEVCDLLGMELRGMPAHALIEDVERDGFNETLALVLKTPHIVELRLEGQIAGGRFVQGRMILLPLQDENGQMTRILGAATLDQELLRPPVRFSITRRTVTRIVSGQAMPLHSRVEGGFAEAPHGFAHQKRPRPVRMRPNLKIVK